MDEDEFVTVSDESLDIADHLMEVLDGSSTSEGVQAIVVTLTNILAATAPGISEANDMCSAIMESVKKSIESMDTDRLCRWSKSKLN